MRVITRRRLLDFEALHPDSREGLERWFRIAGNSSWVSIDDVHRIFPHADVVRLRSGRTLTVFNISGNKYRLVVAIHFNRRTVYIREILTHAEYSRQDWKERN